MADSRRMLAKYKTSLRSCDALLKMLSLGTEAKPEVNEVRVIAEVHVCDGHLLFLHLSRATLLR